MVEGESATARLLPSCSPVQARESCLSMPSQSGLTRAMAVDHAADNIRVNCIMPGLMWTPRLENSSPEAREMRQTSTPLPVEGQGWDIGYAALYLASDEARFVTGITLPVDGGFLLTSAPN